ncbi:MAG: vitamin K epoxide reductase family protein [Candidatus Dormibacteria bacterium]
MDRDAEDGPGVPIGPWALLVFALAGLGLSAYLTTVHYAGVAPLCTTGGFVNCEAVTSSSYSVVPGTSIPVTVPGMIWFIVSGALAVVALRCTLGGHPEPRWLRSGHAVWAGLGMVSVLYFIWAEVVQLHELCEWCTGVHVLVFCSLLVTVARLQTGAPEEEA